MIAETELLELVIYAIKREGFPMEIEEYDLEQGKTKFDGTLKIKGIKKPVNFELVKWAENQNTGVLIYKAKLIGEDGILIADYINPNMAQRLKDEGVQFLDTCGNAYINNQKYFIYVKGNKKKSDFYLPNRTAGQLFNTVGLKVIFALLNDEELINQTYRDIANRANVALGNLTKIFAELKEEGFLVEIKQTRKLIDKERLFQKWVEHYPYKLKNKMFLGEYMAPTPEYWKNINIKQYHAVLGGEVAAEKLTHYLKPQDMIVYLPKAEKFNFVKDAELKKLKDRTSGHLNIVALYEPFWKINEGETYAPKPLVYADLIATGNGRNIEVANIIYKDFIVGYLR